MQTPTFRSLLKALVFAACALGATASAHAAYVLTEVTRPGYSAMALWDINNNGTMVGYSNVGPTDLGSAFIYDGTSFVSLNGPAGAIASYALGISDTGRVVGSFTTAALGPSHGFIYAGGSYTTFDVAGANETFLRGISPDGRYISGYYSTATQAGVGFVYDTLLGTIAIVSAPTSVFTIAQGINSSGMVAGGDILAGPPSTRPGFLYDIATGTRTDQSIAGATRTALRSIDDAGLVAGWFIDSGGQHGFFGSVSSFEQIDFLGADSTTIEGSNNARFLVGQYFMGDTFHAYIATPVPEPATWGLLAAGLGALAWSRSRQRTIARPRVT
jgi:probable HAF family extracellular repeat protein